MSFDEEWAAAKVATRLNSASADGGGGELEVHQDHIGAVGSEAYRLHARLSADGKHAHASTAEAAGALSREGFASGGALLKVNTRWERQLKTLVAACAHISNGLNYSLSSHRKEEEQLHADFTSSKIESLLK